MKKILWKFWGLICDIDIKLDNELFRNFVSEIAFHLGDCYEEYHNVTVLGILDDYWLEDEI